MLSAPISDLSATIKRAAEDAGFDLAGIAPAHDVADLQHFPEWIAAGRAGEMKYMEARDDQGELKRASLARVAPWARSVIVCALNYNTDHPYSTQVRNPDRGWISRYAWNREDYHDAVLRRLRRVEETVRAACGPDFTSRSYVDTGPIVERAFAKHAGVGWIGKNTCLINQKKGSWLFLGVILTSLALEPDLPATDRCGTCTRCIQACPTDALLGPYELDSNRCISYLTIEKRGAIPVELRSGIGHQIFGCDICQDVCPWNRKAPSSSSSEFEPQSGLVNPPLDWLVDMTPEEFSETFRGSPIRRAKRTGLRRNALIAIGNSGRKEFLPLLQRLASDQDEVVAESARWSIQRLNHPEIPDFVANKAT